MPRLRRQLIMCLCVCQVVGLYRLCGSAAVKKELRDWFERNSSAVCLSEDLYPDINVITGMHSREHVLDPWLLTLSLCLS